jgi:hypothetical protein
MTFLFWTCIIIDILLVALTVAGSNFRSSFGASTDFNTIALIVYGLSIAGAIICRFAVKPKWVSLLIAALPVLILFLLYLFEKKTGSSL